MEYRNESQLRGCTLQKGDVVVFTIPNGETITYNVRDKYLDNATHGANCGVFNALGMNGEAKRKFCEDCYGYEPNPGDWPETKGTDMPALTCVVGALYYKIEGLPPPVNIAPVIWKAGMKVKISKRECSGCTIGQICVLGLNGRNDLVAINSRGIDGCSCKDNWELVTTTDDTKVIGMELNDIKKANLAEAAKQVATEKMNAEIMYAKEQLKNAQNQIDAYDRQIKQAEDGKKPYLEIVAKFK